MEVASKPWAAIAFQPHRESFDGILAAIEAQYVVM